jgi:polyisoprenoid-binding protein YceI
MKKIIIGLLSCLLAINSFSQGKYMTRTGHISFISNAPQEKIEANNYQVSSALTTAGDLIFQVPVKSFEFKQALMQDHFNENYLESDKYPKATFKGKILNMDKLDLKKDGKFPVDVEGDLSMHGVTKKIITKGQLEIKGNKIMATATFPIALKDYNISIPKIAKEKLAEIVDVKAELNYELTK